MQRLEMASAQFCSGRELLRVSAFVRAFAGDAEGISRHNFAHEGDVRKRDRLHARRRE
jgi:hypothetical protein